MSATRDPAWEALRIQAKNADIVETARQTWRSPQAEQPLSRRRLPARLRHNRRLHHRSAQEAFSVPTDRRQGRQRRRHRHGHACARLRLSRSDRLHCRPAKRNPVDTSNATSATANGRGRGRRGKGDAAECAHHHRRCLRFGTRRSIRAETRPNLPQPRSGARSPDGIRRLKS